MGGIKKGGFLEKMPLLTGIKKGSFDRKSATF
jgi:hypothetical protein